MDLEVHIRFQEWMEESLRAGNPVDILAAYLGAAAPTIRKSSLEWALVELLDRSEGELSARLADSWPEERLASPSGAALRFVVSQRMPNDQDSVLPLGLSRWPPLAGHHKELLARAWLRCPTAPALALPELRRDFVYWLARHPPTIGSCLLAAGVLNDRELIDVLAPRWLTCGLLHPGAPAEVARASELPALVAPARHALRLVIGRFFRDDEALALLLEPSLSLGDAESAATLGEVLVARATDRELRRRALAVRLAAFSLAQRSSQLAVEYRQRWQPTGWDYPWPERLLYLFQEIGADDLARHLLDNMEICEKTPGWVLLMRKTLESTSQGPTQLEAWEKFYAQHPKDERALVGATCAVLRCPRPVRNEWVERLGLRSRWRQLAEFERYRWLGGAFLVLLHTEEEDRIAEFESRLTEAPLDLPVVQRAARSYLAALRRSRQWQRLDEIWVQRPEILRRVCPFAEREFLRNLTGLSELPVDRRAERRWCQRWEQLISLPLRCSEVVEALDHFVNLRRELERHGHLRHEGPLFADVTLQFLRRAQAEAEALLAQHPGRDGELREFRKRLTRSGLESILQILQELSATLPAENLDCGELGDE